MLRFILASFVLWLTIPFAVFAQTDQTDLLKALLDLPAPPPFERKAGAEDETDIAKDMMMLDAASKIEKGEVPPDDASIEVLLAFWGHFTYREPKAYLKAKLTDVVADRIFDEIKDKPVLLINYLNILPSKNEYIEFAKQFYDEKKIELDNKTEVDYEEISKPHKSVSEAITAAEEIARQSKTFDDSTITSYTLERVKKWLTSNSKYYSDELVKKANKINVHRSYDTNKETLITLAKVDWEKAEPLIEKMLEDRSKPAMMTLATWASYTHFLYEDDERGASKYRRMLQETVEDNKATDIVRNLALEALIAEKDFDGRDDWYISLLADETLYNLGGNTSLKTFMEISDSKKWIPKMLELVGHSNSNVHKAAVRNLVTLLRNSDEKEQKQILTTLLPWLSDPNWADPKGNRVEFIRAYSKVIIPESVPGLISIVQNEKNAISIDEKKDATDKMKDSLKDGDKKDEASSPSKRLSHSQDAAITVLSKYKDSRAVPVLQGAFADTDLSYQHLSIITALIESNGYSADQLSNSVETVVRRIVSEGVVGSIDEVYYDSADEDYKLEEKIGLALLNYENIDEDVIRLVIEREKNLRKTEPAIAGFLRQVLQKWKSKVIDIERLTSISNNTADVGAIVKALAERKELLQKYPNQVFAMRGNGGIASGISACMMENQSELLGVINSGDINTKVAGYACARLLRLPLPIDIVGALLNSANELLALAAERYLTAEDSVKARHLVLAKYPNQAKILGSRNAFMPDPKGNYDNLPISELFASIDSSKYFYKIDLGAIDKTQDKLRKEVIENPEILGTYAFLANEVTGHKILRIYKDKAIYSWYEDDARFRERIVKKEDLQLIYQYVTDNRIDRLDPILSSCHHGCPSTEFVMFGRNGGRRIYIYAGYIYEQPLYGLEMIFSSLEQGESKLRYHLQDKIAGLQIILDEKQIKAKSLWKNGDDFRVLVLDEKRETEIEEELEQQSENARSNLKYDDFDQEQWKEFYRRSEEIRKEIEHQRIERKTEPYAWRSVSGNKLGESVSQPAEDHTMDLDGKFPEIDNLDTPTSVRKARSSTFEIRTGDYRTNGIWKVTPDGLANQVLKGNYTDEIVISEDGKWAILTKGTGEYGTTDIYRFNLQTGKEYKINLPDAINETPVAYIRSQNKFLVFRNNFSNLNEHDPYEQRLIKKTFGKEKLEKSKPTYYLLDAKTGKFEVVKGEFRPYIQIKNRSLQKTSDPDIFWAAIPDEKKKQTQIGRYNAKTFKFTEVMKIPEIKLTSMDIWIDEKDLKIYFIYEGHLLSLPFKPNE